MSIDTLLPKKLDKADDSYKSVVELDEVLSSAKELNIKNIALSEHNLKYHNTGLGKSVELVESLALVKAVKQEQNKLK